MTLEVENTKISELYVNLLKTLRKLQTFEAWMNLIRYINTNLFRNNLQLETIDLQGNEIKQIDEKIVHF